MDRRAFITMVSGSTLAAPFLVDGQQSRIVRIGWLLSDPKPFALDPFRQELKARGWIAGDNLVIEERYSQSVAERYLQFAAELVRLKIDVLVTDGTGATKAAQQTTPRKPWHASVSPL